jgi:hypothetical protein
MASPPAEGAPDPAQGKGKEEEKKGGGVLGRLWRGLFGGREDYEKRLQYLSKEEASVHARMRRRTQLSRRTVRNIIVLSVLAEVAAQIPTAHPSPFSFAKLASPRVCYSYLRCDLASVGRRAYPRIPGDSAC